MSIEKLTRDSKFTDFVNAWLPKSPCVESVDKYTTLSNSDESLTLGEVLDQFNADSSIGQDWAAWTLKVLADDLAEDVRISFIEKITDPMTAFQVYLEMNDLSKEEDELLLAKFEGKLPNAEQELLDGIVTRVK